MTQDIVKQHGSVSAAAKALGIPRTTLRWRLAAQRAEEQEKLVVSSVQFAKDLGEAQRMLQDLKQEHGTLVKLVSKLSLSLQRKAEKDELDYAIRDVKETITWVHRQNPYRNR